MYVSAGHGTHGALLLLSLYLPSAQLVHGPPAAPSNPVLHVQFATAVAAMCGSKLPGGHVVQFAVPFVSLYLPATHATHGPPSGPLYPTLHGQRLEPATEFEFVGHARQADDPDELLNILAAHATQAPPFGPVNPALHVHAATAALALGEFEFAAHARHAVASFAPVLAQYVPASQSVHTALPFVALYFPATQAVQNELPSGPVNPALHLQSVMAELPLTDQEFDAHVTHVDTSVARTLVEKVPGKQSVHGALPVAVLYFPVTQPLHTPPFGPVNPALHVQAASAELAAGELASA
jgi:hypothetical protein